MTTDPAHLATLFASWLPARRWYATKHLQPHIERVVASPAPGEHARALAAAGTEILEVTVTDRPRPASGGNAAGVGSSPARAATVVYQVPLVRTSDRGLIPDDAVVGQDWDGRWLVDATAVPDYAGWLLDAEITGIRVLTEEQSNTSVIVQRRTRPDVIVKLFRVLAEGSNPDAELLEALTNAQVDRVPRFVTARWGSWSRDHEVEYGHLCVVSEFISDAADAWRMAVAAAGDGTEFDAAGLGRATAQIHHSLAQTFPQRMPDRDARQAVVNSWRTRAQEAMAAVPALAEHSATIEAVFAATLESQVSWPALQRIHGDLHLGQVISSPSRGWIVLDFEGEPLRPLAKRRHVDLALRDVAGMLRSFDYAAGPNPSAAGLEWVARQQRAFVEGYAALGGDPAQFAVILTALQLDKALYEARYEASNRPDWLPIPLRGVQLLLG